MNYIFFDQEMNYVRAGFLQITTAAQGIGVHETISLNDIIADRKGYLLAYLSNENAEEVAIHWDDFTVYHGKTNVVFASSYYPFGMQYNSYQRIASSTNFMNTFQNQEYDAETGWVQFKWRNHMPDIGRFFNIDPLATSFYYNSSYAFSENKITSHFELEGSEAVSIHVKTFAPFEWFGAGGWKGDGIDRTFSANPASSYRTGGFINYDADQGVTGFAAYDPGESHTRWGATALSESNLNVKNETIRNLSFHSFGDNDALIPGIDGLGFGLSPTHDIDVSGNLNFNVSNLEDGNKLLQIFGSVWGDGFPSAELFVTQPDGKNGVFLGTSPAHYGDTFGPFLGLIGAGVIPMMGVNASLVMDAQNNILGVKQGDQTISIEEWNKQFENNPVTEQ